MDKIKKQALEAAGWKFGDAEDFLNEGGMMDADKMRAEFEAWAKAVGHDLSQTKGDDRYWFVSTESAWESWQAAYAAGRKAEREAMQLKNWDGIRIGTTHKPEGDNERG